VPTGLSEAFAGNAEKQAQWKAFATRSRISVASLTDVVSHIRAGLAAPIERARQLKKTTTAGKEADDILR
jgi:hypothetical protein